jgi:hypothetical protein
MDRTDGKVKTEAWAGSSSGNRNPMLGDIILGILLLMSILLILHAVGIRKMSEIDAFRDKFLFPLLKFFRDSIRLVKRCTKPTRKGKFSAQSYLHFCFLVGSWV